MARTVLLTKLMDGSSSPVNKMLEMGARRCVPSIATRLMIYMEKRLKGFEPIVSENSRVLILGSMPSVVSLEKQEYYGFKHNRFWKIMGLYAGCRWESYEMKKRFILQEGFALWDVIDSCEREGSLDSKIKNIKSAAILTAY